MTVNEVADTAYFGPQCSRLLKTAEPAGMSSFLTYLPEFGGTGDEAAVMPISR